MTLLDKTLSALGLMRVKAAKDWEAKFKLAVTDLEKQDREVEALKADLAEREMLNHSLDAERNELIDLAAGRLEMNQRLTVSLAQIETDRNNWRDQAMRDEADAIAMRKKRAADRKRMAGKRRKGSGK